MPEVQPSVERASVETKKVEAVRVKREIVDGDQGEWMGISVEERDAVSTAFRTATKASGQGGREGLLR